MIARDYILKGEDRFQRVEREGKLFQSESFGMAVFDRKDKDNPRFGFVVSTKVAKESTLRNRIKRAISEKVRRLVFDTKRGLDVVFLAKPNALRVPTDGIMREVEEAFQKAKLFVKK